MTADKDQDPIQVEDSIDLEDRAQRTASMRERCARVLPFSESGLQVAILTGGLGKPFALGLATALVLQGIFLGFAGSDGATGPEVHINSQGQCFNLWGGSRSGAGIDDKTPR